MCVIQSFESLMFTKSERSVFLVNIEVYYLNATKKNYSNMLAVNQLGFLAIRRKIETFYWFFLINLNLYSQCFFKRRCKSCCCNFSSRSVMCFSFHAHFGREHILSTWKFVFLILWIICLHLHLLSILFMTSI